MTGVHPLDALIGNEFPVFRSGEDVRVFEQTPYATRVAARSTYEALQRGSAVDPDAPAIHFLRTGEPDEVPVTMSYRQFISRVNQTANLLHDLGVGPGDTVSLMLPLIPQNCFALFGAEAAGIANPVNPLLEPYQIAEILKAAGTKVLVALGPAPGVEIWEKVQRVRAELPGLKAILQVGGPVSAADERDGVRSFDAGLDRFPSDRLTSGRAIRPEDPCAYFHTGGTTGTPKLVRHTHANQVYQAWGVRLLLKTRPRHPILMGLPLYHVGGALSQVLVTLSGGGAVVILTPSGWRNSTVVRNVWRLVAKYRPQTFSAVPTVLAASLSVPTAGCDLSSLTCSAGGGSAIPVEVCKGLQELTRTPTLEVYGMTETSSVHTLSYPDRPVRLGSVGHALPYSRVRVVKLDEAGKLERDCGIDEIGVVAMAGPGVFSGYVNPAHNTHAFVEPGWVNSGDLGRLDPEGYLWITGRAKDLIIRGGHNIDPLPIEEILYQHPAVGLAAVVAQPDARAGELPVAYVQLKPDVTVEPADLLEWIRQRAPERAAVPVDLFPIPAMPLTGVGKVFKPELRWDAARRVFAQLLAPLGEQGMEIAVQVGADPTYGSLATVSVRGAGPDARTRVEQQVKERLAPFVIRHEIVWATSTPPPSA
jgi:fatty-acyl-CoA synthase